MTMKQGDLKKWLKITVFAPLNVLILYVMQQIFVPHCGTLGT
jgi:hypothetical protein